MRTSGELIEYKPHNSFPDQKLGTRLVHFSGSLKVLLYIVNDASEKNAAGWFAFVKCKSLMTIMMSMTRIQT